MIAGQSENSKLKFKQTAFLATVYNISTPFPVRHAQSLFCSRIFTIQAAGVRFLPRPCFYGAITVYYKVSIVPFHQEGNILWTLNFPARTPAAFSSTRTPRPSPNASASPASRLAARAAASRSTRSSRCLSAQSSSTCRCPPSTCMPKSSTVSCCCFASRTASARSSPPAFRARGPRATSRSSKSSAPCPLSSWR